MAKTAHISTYETVDRTDFPAMIDVTRYGRRSPHFDEMIRRTDEHFWDPSDPDYIRFDIPLDADCGILPTEMVPELQSAVADRLDDGQKATLMRNQARWIASQLLHGEQGAFNLSVSLCDLFVDPGAQEYMGNQVREEGRHVNGFTKYILARFPEGPYPAGDTLAGLLTDVIRSDKVYKKVIGMQMMVEGLAMGAFATLHSRATDPVLSRLCQLTMTDEAFHHQFGKIWANTAVPDMTEEERDAAEDWALETFNILRENLVNSVQKRVIYQDVGLDWEWVRGAMMEAFTDTDRREAMKESTNIFRTLIKTIQKAGLITDRTRDHYALWVDLEELKSEGDRMVGDAIAEALIPELVEIGRSKGTIIKKITED